jgi:hypothetical protein
MGYAIAWLVLCGLIGFIAMKRGRSSVGWFFLALFLSPLTAGLALAIMPPRHYVHGPASPRVKHA